MSAPIFRLVEDPLGPSALEPLDRAELLEAWAKACRQPIPNYAEDALGQFLRRGYRRGK